MEARKMSDKTPKGWKTVGLREVEGGKFDVTFRYTDDPIPAIALKWLDLGEKLEPMTLDKAIDIGQLLENTFNKDTGLRLRRPGKK